MNLRRRNRRNADNAIERLEARALLAVQQIAVPSLPDVGGSPNGFIINRATGEAVSRLVEGGYNKKPIGGDIVSLPTKTSPLSEVVGALETSLPASELPATSVARASASRSGTAEAVSVLRTAVSVAHANTDPNASIGVNAAVAVAFHVSTPTNVHIRRMSEGFLANCALFEQRNGSWVDSSGTPHMVGACFGGNETPHLEEDPFELAAGSYVLRHGASISSHLLSRGQVEIDFGQEEGEAPDLEPIADQAVTADELLEFNVVATDPDSAPEDLTFSLDAASLARGMTIDENTGLITWTPSMAQAGEFSVTATVTDETELTHSQTFVVTVVGDEIFEWFEPNGGNFDEAAFWSRNDVPGADDAIRFDLDNTYTVSLGPDNVGNRLLQADSGHVRLNLFGNTYRLSNDGEPDLLLDGGWLTPQGGQFNSEWAQVTSGGRLRIDASTVATLKHIDVVAADALGLLVRGDVEGGSVLLVGSRILADRSGSAKFRHTGIGENGRLTVRRNANWEAGSVRVVSGEIRVEAGGAVSVVPEDLDSSEFDPDLIIGSANGSGLLHVAGVHPSSHRPARVDFAVPNDVLAVGNGGEGELRAEDSGIVTVEGDLQVGVNGGDGRLVVRNLGSIALPDIEGGGFLSLGLADGTGELLIEGGGLVETKSAQLGSNGDDPAIGTGVATIRGLPSLWTIDDWLVIDGQTGTQLVVEDRARVMVGDVEDTEIREGVILDIGQVDDGILQIRNGAVLHAGAGEVHVGTNGGTAEVIVNSGGRFVANGAVVAGALPADLDPPEAFSNISVRGADSGMIADSIILLGRSEMAVDGGAEVNAGATFLSGNAGAALLSVEGEGTDLTTGSLSTGIGAGRVSVSDDALLRVQGMFPQVTVSQVGVLSSLAVVSKSVMCPGMLKSVSYSSVLAASFWVLARW